MLLVFRVIGVTPGAGRGANILNSLVWDASNVLDRLGVVVPEGPDPFAYWGVLFFAWIMRYLRRWGHRYSGARGVIGGKGFLVGASLTVRVPKSIISLGCLGACTLKSYLHTTEANSIAGGAI